MQLTGPRAAVLASVIGVIGIVVGAFMNPIAVQLINKPTPTPAADSLAIEQIPQQIFAYAGNDNPDGGWGAFWLYYKSGNKPVYKLEFTLPDDKNGYAGLAFEFMEGMNFSDYKAVECAVIFDRMDDVVDLYFKDIAGNFNTVRVANNGANEMSLRYEFTNFPTVNFNALEEFGVVASTDFTRGSHHVRIKNIRFVK